MAEQFHVHFADPHAAGQAETRLKALRLGNRPVMTAKCNGNSVFSGCSVYDDTAADAVLSTSGVAGGVPFFEIFYKVDGKKSGMHHPDGMLWIRGPDRTHRIHPDKVPLTMIAPLVLAAFGLDDLDRIASQGPVLRNA